MKSRRWTLEPAGAGMNRMNRALTGLLLAGAATLVGCDAESGRGSSDRPLEAVAERGLEEVFRLGGLEGPEEEAFSAEPALAVDGDGVLYALHRDRGEVAVFDLDGRFVRWIRGGRGEGPGEFTTAGRMGLVGDTLWIRNRTPPRISRFLRDGTHLGTDPALVEDAGYLTTAGVQGVSGYLQGGRAWMEPDGFVMSPGPQGPGGAQGPAEAPFVLGDRAMEARQTVFSWRAGRGRLAGTSFAPLPEPPFHHVAPDGSSVLLADWSAERPEAVSVRLISPDGDDLRAWTLAVPVVPVPSALRDSLVEAGREQLRRIRENVIAAGISENEAPSVPSAEEVREAAYLPVYHPPLRDVRIGLDGTIWVQRTDGLEAGPWVALDPDGVPLFRLRLPAGARLRQASRDAVWATASDDLDVPYVVRWALTDPDSGGEG